MPQPLRYRGYWYDGWDDGAGLWDAGHATYASNDDRPLPWYWLTNRYYDPVLERFLEPDPSAQDGVRSYAYCGDAPVDCADPSGLEGVGPGRNPGLDAGPVGSPYRPGIPATEASGNLGGTTFPGIEGASGTEQLPLFDMGDAGPTEAVPDLADPVAARFGFDKAGAYVRAKAAQALLRGKAIPSGKTASITDDGTAILSGKTPTQGYAEPQVSRVLIRGKTLLARFGFQFVGSGAADNIDNGGEFGEGKAAHAEPQLLELRPGVPQAVSRWTCDQCSLYTRAFVQSTGEPQMYLDPTGVITYYPDGTVVDERSVQSKLFP